jgi:hypothetical protein
VPIPRFLGQTMNDVSEFFLAAGGFFSCPHILRKAPKAD